MNTYIKTTVIIFFMIGLLMACSEEAHKSNTSSNDGSNLVKNDTEEMTRHSSEVDQIIEEATEINNGFESYSAIEEKDTVEMFNDEKNHLFAKEEVNVIFSPFQFELKIKQEQLDDSDYLEKDFYEQKGGIYLVEGTSYMMLQGEQWSKTEVDYTEEELQDQERIHLDKQVKQYRDVSAHEEFKETDHHYLLMFDLDLDKVTENDQATHEKQMGSPREGYQVNEMEVTIKINKEDLYLETISTNKSYSYEVEYKGEKGKMSVKDEHVIMYENQNNVKDIVIPKEVMENAEKI